MKFRLIQSNDRGLVTRPGDRTFARRGPARGEEDHELPTLFVWVKKPDRLLARCWTRWTGEKLEEDFVYEVTRFRDLIDLQGDTRFHQWCSRELRQQMWELQGPALQISEHCCPNPEAVYEANRHKGASCLQRRKARIKAQSPALSEEEKERLDQIYGLRDSLNQAEGRISYHVDHIHPLAAGGLHHPDNLRVLEASENIRKGAKLLCAANDSQEAWARRQLEH
jgi:5-methylcytosine-specific restriction endonuclease McrA